MIPSVHANEEPSSYEKVGEFIFIYQRGDRWYAYYRLNGRVYRQSLRTDSKKEARRKALTIERELVAGQFSRPAKPPAIVDVMEQYVSNLRALRRAPKTITKVEHCFRLVRELAEKRRVKRIDQIDQAFVDAFRADRISQRPANKKKRKGSVAESARPAMEKTVHNDLVIIKQLLNFAVRRKLVRENPLADLKLTRPKRTPQPFWPRAEAEKIVTNASPRYQPLFRFLADTATRIGEAMWTTWDDVDFEHGLVYIRAKDGWKPKTGNERVIPLSPELRRVLVALPRSAKWVFTAQPSSRCRAAGRQISERRALAHLKTVLKKLGLRGHLHTFRHSFISHALTSGTPESIVRDWVGHVDRDIIRVYTHIADQQSRAAMDRLLPAPDSAGHRNDESKQ